MTDTLHQRTIDEMKASIAKMLCLRDKYTVYSDERWLRTWQTYCGWIPCKQEGDKEIGV